MNKKNGYLWGIFTGIMIALVLLVTYFGIRSVVAFTQSQGLNVVETEFVDPSEKFETILEAIDRNYYETYEKDALYEEAYKGFVDGVGDRYTSYYTAEEYIEYAEAVNGIYEGIGAYVGYGENEGELIIIAPMDGSPSMLAGIEALDRIIAVDEVDVTGMTTTELVKLIKGPKGTDVVMTIARDGEVMDFVVTRDKIEVPTVSHEMLEDQIGYIRISGFDSVTYDQFMIAYNELELQGQESLILDLRYNGGGYTHIVSAIADELLPEGIIYYTEDKNGEQNIIESDEEKRFDKPIVVLVNGSSASASEILAGAIKDHERGVIVGTQSFGKGLVQSGVQLEDGSYVSITIARYYTPDGHYIHGVGIEPDVIAELPEFEEDVEYPDDFDPQLDVAIEEIEKLMDND